VLAAASSLRNMGKHAEMTTEEARARRVRKKQKKMHSDTERGRQTGREEDINRRIKKAVKRRKNNRSNENQKKKRDRIARHRVG
jgi:hypothetical protein